MQQVDIVKASKSLSELIEAVIGGEEVIITRENQPLVRLVVISETKPRPQFGSAKNLIVMSEDFDEPLEDFNEVSRLW
ncbi:MAG: type II toxin-antitoxin system prevent-host-death family antitoxin [Fischerella sp.]|jgi:prevent-host-death family protein|uniref:type II toxin-antitoxin system Phd/YefM family antitoxin n=1 Tax=unclassified Fischerella TaxID=494603 RepID=UPI00047BC46E|nr:MULTISPECIES: type II toxin-antitoxin system prevent-host-death family antitoxin [unclassified Fischerella]NWF59772.1 type II toxin-antitoxin system prevent-host-death family antitoxin [Fischerella sp.]